jgi:hypothetical protein
MTKEEMLKKSGLTDAEFRELVHRFKGFLDSLNPAQRAAVERWLPSAERIAASFGPALTVEDLTRYVETSPDASSGFNPQQGVGLGTPCS